MIAMRSYKYVTIIADLGMTTLVAKIMLIDQSNPKSVAAAGCPLGVAALWALRHQQGLSQSCSRFHLDIPAQKVSVPHKQTSLYPVNTINVYSYSVQQKV